MNKKLLYLIAAMIIIPANTITSQTNLIADVYASYFGTSADEANIYIAVDRSGNVVLAGHTYSRNFQTVSPWQSQSGGGLCDGFITKFNPDMTEIIFSTYLGGNDYDEIKAVAVDSLGNVYVTGTTRSRNFPLTENGYDLDYNGDGDGPYSGGDAFLSKLSPEGILVYSTYFGGNKEDIGTGIAVIDSSTICLTGLTYSNDFPVKLSYTDNLKGDADIFLLKYDISNNILAFSTYLGGTQVDNPSDIKIDHAGNIYIGGSTNSSDFPTGAVLPVFAGKSDGFITRFSKAGDLIYSTFVGGTDDDYIGGIVVDDNKEVFFIGCSFSSGIACSENAFYTEKIGGNDLILGKIDSSGGSISYLSYFGGTGNDNAYIGKIQLAGNDTIVITGNTSSTDFPHSQYAYDTIISGTDIFISVLNIVNKEILYSTYLGGSSNENGFGLVMPNDSVAYFSGISNSSNFPRTSDAFTKNFQGVTDAIMARFKFKPHIVTSINTVSQLNEIQVFPNPTTDIITIYFGSNPIKSAFIEIFRTNGTLVFSQAFRNTKAETITGLPNGMYLIKVIADGINYNEKVLKN